MRPSRILLSLMLFIALPGAHAQQLEPPASLNDSCPPSDPRWTPQEKFVWEHVCLGEDADFNATPSYGGNLDPMEPAGWPQSRVLGPVFLRTILFNDVYRRALKRRGVVIRGARFTEAVDLENAELEHPLELQKSRLEKGINLTRVRSKFLIGFPGSNVAGAFNMYELQLDADLEMQKGKFADVTLIGAHVGTVILDRVEVTGPINMSRLQVDGSLHMRNAEFTKVELVNARVGGELDLNSSNVTGNLNMIRLHAQSLFMNSSNVAGKLDMNGLHVDQSLFMRGKANFAEVELVAAHVGGTLDLSSSNVTGKLGMNGLHVAQSLLMRENAKFAEVELVTAHIDGNLELNSANVTGKLDMNSLKVNTHLLMKEDEFAEVKLVGANVGGQLEMTGSKVRGLLDCHGMAVERGFFMNATFSDSIDCRVAQIKGDLHLENGQFKKKVDLSGAEIGGVLRLHSAQWSRGVTFVLRDAKAGVIPALADGWAPKLDLDGLTYRSAGKVDQFEHWLRRFDRYAPQPYDQLASVVQSQGKSTLATAIRYSGRERERSEATGRAWAWLTTLKWVIGYGYYPYYAMLWVIGLVIAGAIVLRISSEGQRNGMPYGLAYSFDMLLPIIQLRKKHYDIDLQGWPRYYFYGQKIMGWVLGSFLIAGLSGLAK
jgi:hypothetical protein